MLSPYVMSDDLFAAGRYGETGEEGEYLTVDGIVVPEMDDVEAMHEKGHLERLHRRTLLAEDGSFPKPSDLVQLSDGTVARADVLPLDKLHEQAKEVATRELKKEFEVFYKRRKLAQASTAAKYFDLTGLYMHLNTSFDTKLTMTGGEPGLPVSVDLYKEYGGAPLRAHVESPIISGLFRLKVDVEVDVSIPVDIKFKFPGNATATVAMRDLDVRTDLPRVTKHVDVTTPGADRLTSQETIFVKTPNWADTAVTLKRSAAVSVMARRGGGRVNIVT